MKKCTRAHVQENKSIYLSMKTFLKTGVYIYMLHKKTVLVKKRHFYVKKLLFYKLTGCKNTAFLQKYSFVKKELSYVKKLLFYKLSGCKNTAFLQKYIFVKKQLFYIKKLLFYKIYFCKKAAFLCKKSVFLQKMFL